MQYCTLRVGPDTVSPPPSLCCTAGAGACALPMALLVHLPRGARVAAVDSDAEVLSIARSLFLHPSDDNAPAPAAAATASTAGGAAAAGGDGARLRLVEGCGAEFLSGSGEGAFDVVVIDCAGAAGDRGSPGSGLQAPPPPLATAEALRAITRALAPGGVAVVNVFGEKGSERAFEVRGALVPPVLLSVVHALRSVQLAVSCVLTASLRARCHWHDRSMHVLIVQRVSLRAVLLRRSLTDWRDSAVMPRRSVQAAAAVAFRGGEAAAVDLPANTILFLRKAPAVSSSEPPAAQAVAGPGTSSAASQQLSAATVGEAVRWARRAPRERGNLGALLARVWEAGEVGAPRQWRRVAS